MRRRTFISLPTTSALVAAAAGSELPKYKIVSNYQPTGLLGMPGLYPGKVVAAQSAKSIHPQTEAVDAAVVREMMRRAMLELTGDKDVRDCWRRFIVPGDVVGIKLNCSGAPNICSHPVVVAEIVRNLMEVGVKANNIWLYERFQDQVDTVHYEKYVPEGVHIQAASHLRDNLRGYDPKTYVEVDFFGEDDTRSNLVRMITDHFTKIINVPNMKDHGASGVTGCLKNIAYGSFGNVARSHKWEKTNTYSFIGTLAQVEPLKSRTVLQIMDGLRAVWQGGPFAPNPKYRFYPGRISVGTDPVALDRLLIDIIENKRKQEGAHSVWDRNPTILMKGQGKNADPFANRFIREPGHIEYAGHLGLGVYDKSKIQLKEIKL